MAFTLNQIPDSIQGPQGFRTLGLRYAYNTGSYDLASEFFIPLLSRSISYDRGVGYFSSGWLRVNARGLSQLAMRGGRARWVISPQLSQEDIDTFRRIADLHESPKHVQELMQTVDELRTALEHDTRNTVAWMNGSTCHMSIKRSCWPAALAKGNLCSARV